MSSEAENSSRVTDTDRAVAAALKGMAGSEFPTADLARAINKSYQSVDNYLEGRRAIPLQFLVDITKVLDVRIDAVMRRAGLLPESISVEEAMDSDKRLPSKHRVMAKAVYRTFLD